MAYNNFNNNKPHYPQHQQNNNTANPEPFVPLSSDVKTKLKNPNCNFSLYSTKMVSWKFSGKELKVEEKAIDDLFDQSKKSFPTTIDLVKEKSFPTTIDLVKEKLEQQDHYIRALSSQGITTFIIKAETTSPFITGLGSGHPTETGMILDRNIGVPYIPATSIKGVLRLACAINLAKNNEEYAKNGIVPDDAPTLVKYFGSMSQDEKKQTRGQLMFLDAYPKGVFSLKVDIINPHFGNYYNGEHKQPVETGIPKPKKFLTVAEGTTFVFRCAFIPLKEDTCNETEVRAMFTTAFETVGFGGKTAIGYGRFKDISDKDCS